MTAANLILAILADSSNTGNYIAAGSLIFSFLAAGVAITVYITLTRERVERLQEHQNKIDERLQQHEKRIDAKLDASLAELREATSDVRALNQMQHHMGAEASELRGDMKSAAAEVQALIVAVRSAASEQNVLNRITSDLLKSLTMRVEQLETRVNDVAGSVSLLSEVLKAKGALE